MQCTHPPSPLRAQIKGATEPARGFSAMRFVPGTDDKHIIATKVQRAELGVAHRCEMRHFMRHLHSFMQAFISSAVLLPLQTVELQDSDAYHTYITIVTTEGKASGRGAQVPAASQAIAPVARHQQAGVCPPPHSLQVLLPETLISDTHKYEGLEISSSFEEES